MSGLATLVPGPVAVAAPLIAATLGALVAWLPGRRVRSVGAVAAATATAIAATWMVPRVLAEGALTLNAASFLPPLTAHLRVDAAGAAYGSCVAVAWLLATVPALAGPGRTPTARRFLAAWFASLAGLLGVAYAGDLLTLLVAYEAVSLLAYVLIVQAGDARAFRAGTRYLVYVLAGGAAILAGTLLLFGSEGRLAFAPGGAIEAPVSDATVTVALTLLLVGFGVKAATMPLHGWVPEAHPAAPAPVSALLSGVMVAAGGWGLLRVLYGLVGIDVAAGLGVTTPWAAISATTILGAALLAVREPNLKRRLAYSTISQMGYWTLALALASPAVLAAGIVHVVHHAFLKGSLFLCAGVWTKTHGAHRIEDLRGLARRTPWTAAAFAVASLAMMGVPPLSGFVTKWHLGVGTVQADAGWALAVVLAGALLAAAYLLPVVHALYLAPLPTSESDETVGRERSVPSLVLPALLAASTALIFGLAARVPGLPLDVARQAAAQLIGGG